MPSLSRLSRMPPRELAYRLGEKCRIELERRNLHSPPPPAPRDFKTYLQSDPRRRFYRGVQDRLRERFEKEHPDWIARAREEAEKLCRHEFALLNYERVSLGAKIDWHRDPITGQIWERRFWADYDPERDAAGRDSKRIHELNRHQHLPRLAKAFYLTGEDRYAAEAVAQMESWIDQNPPGGGINWQSSLEIALRCISWLWTICLLPDSKAFDEARAQRIGNSLFAQLQHVYTYTSRYSSPNTHLIGEAAALFIAGLTFQDQKPAAAWLDRGATVLIEEAGKQILSDGVYGELSSYYHCYALDFYLQALVLAERNRFPFPEAVRQKISGMLRFVAALTRRDGSIPLLGDDDGGRALALERKSYRSFSDALGAGAEESFWLLGSDPCRSSPAFENDEMIAVFPAAGYAIQRSREDHLVFDFGGLGMLTGGHSHADALSLTYFSKGRDVLVDPGTFVYTGVPEWREYFRSTRAHNTVEIDSHGQAESSGTFRWKNRWKAKLGSLVQRDSVGYIEAEHDAYRGLGVTHRRRLFHVFDEYLILADDFSGSGLHTFDLYFQFGQAVSISEVECDGGGVAAREKDGLLLGLHASGVLSAELLTAESRPIAGWISDGYGAKHASQTLRATVREQAPASVITFLIPSAADTVFCPLAVDGAVACACRSSLVEDIAVVPSMDEAVVIGDFVLQGEFFWLRLIDGTFRQVAAIRAKFLKYAGQTIFERSTPENFFNDRVETALEMEVETVCAPSAAF